MREREGGRECRMLCAFLHAIEAISTVHKAKCATDLNGICHWQQGRGWQAAPGEATEAEAWQWQGRASARSRASSIGAGAGAKAGREPARSREQGHCHIKCK